MSVLLFGWHTISSTDVWQRAPQSRGVHQHGRWHARTSSWDLGIYFPVQWWRNFLEFKEARTSYPSQMEGEYVLR